MRQRVERSAPDCRAWRPARSWVPACAGMTGDRSAADTAPQHLFRSATVSYASCLAAARALRHLGRITTRSGGAGCRQASGREKRHVHVIQNDASVRSRTSGRNAPARHAAGADAAGIGDDGAVGLRRQRRRGRRRREPAGRGAGELRHAGRAQLARRAAARERGHRGAGLQGGHGRRQRRGDRGLRAEDRHAPPAPGGARHAGQRRHPTRVERAGRHQRHGRSGDRSGQGRLESRTVGHAGRAGPRDLARAPRLRRAPPPPPGPRRPAAISTAPPSTAATGARPRGSPIRRAHRVACRAATAAPSRSRWPSTRCSASRSRR